MRGKCAVHKTDTTWGNLEIKKQAPRDRATNIARIIASTWLIAVRPDGQLTRANGHRLKSQEKQMLAVGGAHVITERVEFEAESCVAD